MNPIAYNRIYQLSNKQTIALHNDNARLTVRVQIETVLVQLSETTSAYTFVGFQIMLENVIHS